MSASPWVLVAVEPGDGPLAAAGHALVAEGVRLARELGAGLRAVTWAAEVDAGAEAVAAALVRAVRGGASGDSRGAAGDDSPEGPAPVAVLLADTDLGRQVAPMVADRLGSGAVIGAGDVLVRLGDSDGSSALSFVKPVYGGWLERDIESAAGTVPVVTLNLEGMPEPQAPEDLPAVERLHLVPGGAVAVRSLELLPPDARTVDLVHAKRIVAAGSGSASDKLLGAARELAELLEGSVGATRPVVDDGRLPKERLIGQTGRTVSPELYVALGISGSPHHVAGVRKADKILAINRDVRAPIFQFSDVGYVADLQEVLPALVERLKEYRDAPGRPQ